MCAITGYLIIALGLLQLAGVTTLGTLVGGELGTGALLVLAGIAYTLVARRTCAGAACRVPEGRRVSPPPGR